MQTDAEWNIIRPQSELLERTGINMIKNGWSITGNLTDIAVEHIVTLLIVYNQWNNCVIIFDCVQLCSILERINQDSERCVVSNSYLTKQQMNKSITVTEQL